MIIILPHNTAQDKELGAGPTVSILRLVGLPFCDTDSTKINNTGHFITGVANTF